LQFSSVSVAATSLRDKSRAHFQQFVDALAREKSRPCDRCGFFLPWKREPGFASR